MKQWWLPAAVVEVVNRARVVVQPGLPPKRKEQVELVVEELPREKMVVVVVPPRETMEAVVGPPEPVYPVLKNVHRPRLPPREDLPQLTISCRCFVAAAKKNAKKNL